MKLLFLIAVLSFSGFCHSSEEETWVHRNLKRRMGAITDEIDRTPRSKPEHEALLKELDEALIDFTIAGGQSMSQELIDAIKSVYYPERMSEGYIYHKMAKLTAPTEGWKPKDPRWREIQEKYDEFNDLLEAKWRHSEPYPSRRRG